MNQLMNTKLLSILIVFACASVLSACSNHPSLPQAKVHQSLTSSVDNYQYLIGPGDRLTIFVWRNPDVSGTFTVRPDGMLTTSLVEDVDAAGKTPSQLARELESALGTYLRDPVVSVIVEGFAGPFSEQVRVIGEAAQPASINYSQNMTLLDVMIGVGGLTEFADGNAAKLVRVVDGEQRVYHVRLDDLIRSGDIQANVDILPGDIVIIPEAWF